MRRKEAYVWWNGGTCFVFTYPAQKFICSSKNFRRAAWVARRRGFHVKVYKSWTSKAPKDAIDVTGGSYVLAPIIVERDSRQRSGRGGAPTSRGSSARHQPRRQQ